MLEFMGILALLWFGAAPLAVYRGTRAATDPTIEALDPERLEQQVLLHLEDGITALEALGFRAEAFLRLPDVYSNVDNHLVLLTRREVGDMAIVTAMRNREADAARRMLFVSFCTRLDTQRSVETFNADTPSAFRVPVGRIAVQTPHIRDVARLYRLHHFILRHRARIGEHERGLIFPEGEAPAYLAETLRRSHDEQVAAGLMRLDAARDAYRPTLRGAYEMSWKLMWPTVALRRQSIEREGRAIEAAMLRAEKAQPVAEKG